MAPEKSTAEILPGLKQLPDTDAGREDRLRKALDDSTGSLGNVCDMKGYPKRTKESERVLKALDENEEGDGYLFIRLHRGKFIYDRSSDEWHYWNDNHWRFDIAGQAQKAIKKVVELYGNELLFEQSVLVKALENDDQKQIKKSEDLIKRLRRRIFDLGGLKRQMNVLKVAGSGVGSLWCSGNEWDTNPWLLGVRNGVLDLKQGMFRPGQPEDFIKTVSPVKWEGFEAQCPTWEQYIRDIFMWDDNDAEGLEVVNFMQELLGYCITGLQTEAIYPICWGPDGRNGKSTLFEILNDVLGDMAWGAPDSLIIQSKSGFQPSHDAGKIGLKGKRIIWCSETNAGDAVNAAKTKTLTGGDVVTARAPYGKHEISFYPTHKLFTHTNENPRIPANDNAIWTRVFRITFKFHFCDDPKPKTNQKLKDRGLKGQLKKELPGILAWLVKGCLMWQERGMLVLPKSIFDDTAQYRKDEDIVGNFLQVCCIEGQGEQLRAPSNELYSAYKEWCVEDNHRPMGRNRFYKDMDARYGKRRKTMGAWYYDGVLLIDNWRANL